MILHVIDSLAPGGAERAVVSLVQALHQRGLSVGVCITRRDSQLAVHLPPQVPLLTLGRDRRWDFAAIRRFVHWCAEQQVRVVHVHGRTSLHFIAVARLLGLRAPKVLFHDHFGRIVNDRTVPVSLRFAFRFAVDHYLCVAPDLAVWACEQVGIPASRVTLLPNALEPADWPLVPMPAETAALHAPVLAAYVANYRPQKGHEVLFAAVASDPFLRQQLRVHCVGNDIETPYGTQVRQMAERMFPNGEVSCEGISHNVSHVIGAADFGIVASHSEAGPIVSLEYMAMGRPYVGTRTGEVVRHAWRCGACVVCPPSDPQSLAAALRTMVECSPAQRQAMGAVGRQLVEERYSIAHSAQVLTRLYGRLGATV